MRPNNRARLSRLGQVSAPTPFGKVALANSVAYTDENEVRQAWGSLAVKADASEVVRFARVVANDNYYQFLPDDSFYAAVFNYHGSEAGKLTYVPLTTFMSAYRIVKPGATQAVVDAGLPLPSTFESSVTTGTFAKAVMDGLDFAHVALNEAQRGNSSMAQTRLNLKGAGAAAMLSKANVELGILMGLGVVSKDQAADFGENLVKPLANVIGEARAAILRQGSVILATIDMIKSVAQGAALNLRGFAEKEWVKFAELYAAAYKGVLLQQQTVQKLEALGASTLVINDLKDGLLKGKALLSGMEAQLKAIGVNIAELRAELKLEGLGIPAALAKVLAGIAAAFTTQAIVHSISVGFWMGFGTIMFEKLIVPIFRSHATEVEEARKAIQVQTEAQRLENEARKARGEKTETDKAIERIRVNLDAMKNGVDVLKDASSVGNDPVFGAKVNEAEGMLGKAEQDAASVGATSSGVHPVVLVGGIAAAAYVLYLLFKKKE